MFGQEDTATKQQVLNEITELLDMRPVRVLKGSTLPAAVFEEAARRAQVPYESMPQVCQAIVRKAGLPYLPEYDSTLTPSGGGSTVTLDGLQAMRDALRVLL